MCETGKKGTTPTQPRQAGTCLCPRRWRGQRLPLRPNCRCREDCATPNTNQCRVSPHSSAPGFGAIFTSVEVTRERGPECPLSGRARPAIGQTIFMLTHTTKLSDQKPIRWDQHCLLVIPFPFSLQTELRRTARFAHAKRGLRQSLVRFAPSRVLGFFLHPSTIPFSLGFSRGGKHPGSEGPPPHSHSVLPV